MQDILEDFSVPAIMRAMEINQQMGWIRFGRWLGAIVHDEPELLWFVTSLPYQFVNGIARADFPPERFEKTFDEKLTQLTALRVPMAWLIGPSTQPAGLGNHLQKRGWTLDDAAPGMAVDLRTLDELLMLPSSLTIRFVNDETMLKTWLRTLIVGSEIPEEGLALLLDAVAKHGYKEDPDLRYYLGLFDDEPVATSLLYLAGGVANIYCVATLPQARGQGFGTALTLEALLDARKLGYRIGTLQSSPMGFNLYRRLGFREYGAFQVYFWQAE